MDFKIIDMHMHVGHSADYVVYDATVEAQIRQMDALGIELGLHLGREGLRDEYAKGIESCRRIHRESNGRIFSCFNFGPLHPDVAVEEMRKNYPDPVFRGLKIHPSGSFVDADDDRYEAAWKVARELKIPIIAHTWAISSYHPSQKSAFAGKFERFISAYPDVPFVFAHSGGRWGGLQAAAKIGREYPHTYFDMAGDIWGMDVAEYMVSNVGADRLMYGSDCAMIEQRPMLGVFYGSSLSLADKQKILRENALKLFFPDKA